MLDIFLVVFSVTLTIGRVQTYLAKNNSRSPWYWRNSLNLSNTIFNLSRYDFLDNMALTCEYLFAANFNVNQLIRALYHLPYARRLKLSVVKLDDIVDESPTSWILSLGKASLGPQISIFLQTLLDDEDTNRFHRFVSDGLISQIEMHSFINLLAYKVHRQAQLTLLYAQEQAIEKKALFREQIARENIEITGTCFALLTHFIKKDKRILDVVSQKTQNELTYDIVKAIYPNPTQIGELSQIEDDTLEFRYDLQQELLIGKICPNYFLAHLEKRGILSEVREEMNHLPERTVVLYELPPNVQKEFLVVRQMSLKKASKIGFISGYILWVCWEYDRRVGFYILKPKYAG